jgi:hypothetical protein
MHKAMQIGHLPPTGSIPFVTTPTPTCHQQSAAGKRQKIYLLTLGQLVGEMFLLELVFEPNQITSVTIFEKINI